MFQEALPVTLRQIHIINSIPLLDKLLSLIRPFMRSEVAAMVIYSTDSIKNIEYNTLIIYLTEVPTWYFVGQPVGQLALDPSWRNTRLWLGEVKGGSRFGKLRKLTQAAKLLFYHNGYFI